MLSKFSMAVAVTATAGLFNSVLAAPTTAVDVTQLVRRGDPNSVEMNPMLPAVKNDPSLKTSQNFYWNSRGVTAKMTPVLKDNQKIVHANSVDDWVQSVSCDSNTVSLKFNNAAKGQQTWNNWKWVNGDKSRAIVMIVDDDKCGGKVGRQAYVVSQCTWDASSMTTVMQAKAGDWSDVLADYNVHLETDSAQSGLSTRASVSKTIDITKSFNRNIFSKDISGVSLSVDCVDCSTSGQFNINADFSLTKAPTGTLTTTGGVGANFKFGVTASGQLSSAQDLDFTLVPTIPILTLDGIVSLTLNVAVNGAISSIDAQVTASFGVKVGFPDGAGFGIGSDAQSLSFSPQFSAIDPEVSGSVAVSGNVASVITVGISAAKGLATVDLAFKAPTLAANIKALGDSNGVCGTTNTIGVEFDATVGAEIDLHADIKIPFVKGFDKTLFTTSTDLFNGGKCIAIPGTGPAPSPPQNPPQTTASAAPSPPPSPPPAPPAADTAIDILVDNVAVAFKTVSSTPFSGCQPLAPLVPGHTVTGIGAHNIKVRECITVFDDAACTVNGVAVVANGLALTNSKFGAYQVTACIG